MLTYILQVAICQLLFLLVYDLFLKRETFFNTNRAYLLVTQLLAVVLPLVKIKSFQKLIPQEYVVKLPTVIIGDAASTQASTQTVAEVTQPGFTISLELILVTGMLIAFFIVCYKVYKIANYILRGNKRWKGDFWLVEVTQSNAAFSFLNHIFLGDTIDWASRDSILAHELVHVQQKHSYDLLFFEVLKVLMWFNPLIYVYQKRIAIVHEYIADAKAAKKQTKVTIYNSLLAQVFETNNLSFTNTFFKKSLIKKRIVMLQRNKSKNSSRLKYILALPILMLALTLSSTNLTDNNPSQSELTQNDAFENLNENESPLIKKIKAIRDQIQKQGNVTDEEARGIDLLLQTVSGSSLDMNLVNKIQEYLSAKNKTQLMSRISEVFEQIQMQGNITDEEEKELKVFLLLASENGFESIHLQDYIQYVEIPFAVVGQHPSYPECEHLEGKEKKTCFTNKVSAFVAKNFNIKVAENLGLIGKQRIITQFKIDKKGNVAGVRARAAHPDLEKEAKRVISLLPKMIPGKHKGKEVIVPYSLPILFQVNDKKD